MTERLITNPVNDTFANLKGFIREVFYGLFWESKISWPNILKGRQMTLLLSNFVING